MSYSYSDTFCLQLFPSAEPSAPSLSAPAQAPTQLPQAAGPPPAQPQAAVPPPSQAPPAAPAAAQVRSVTFCTAFQLYTSPFSLRHDEMKESLDSCLSGAAQVLLCT